MAEQKYDDKLKLSFKDSMGVLLPYFKDRIVEQIKCIWFIVAYLCLFQYLVLGLPIVYTLTIAVGIGIVIVGLAFFMEGLRLGLMPLGEVVGSVMPRKFVLWKTLVFAFILGVAATFAEPAIMVLKEAGSSVIPDKAPLLYSLLNDYTDQLVMFVGVGVGLAVALGVLRFFKGWSLKPFIYVGVLVLSSLTAFVFWGPSLGVDELGQALPTLADMVTPILGLAWDCGAVTTGPVTVPLVLALGIGVCRIVSSGDSSNAGFGVVTLASLFPILAVFSLGFMHYFNDDYYGRTNYPAGETAAESSDGKATFQVAAVEKIAFLKEQASKGSASELAKYIESFSAEDLAKFQKSGEIVGDYEVIYLGGTSEIDANGNIVAKGADIAFKRTGGLPPAYKEGKSSTWREPDVEAGDDTLVDVFWKSVTDAVKAILLLCVIMLVTLIVFLREKPRYWDEVFLGILAAIVGMALFLLGIAMGLTPLGEQLGYNVPAAFTTIVPWEMTGLQGPLFSIEFWGKMTAVGFAFILGYGATLAEPALNALGSTVEKITVGSFKKNLLMQSVATGVGCGIATGVLKIAYDIDLPYLLLPPYLMLIALTYISSEEFVNFGWDSAGVTTGPITVPLVMAIGLGIGAKTGAIDGFGVLALASVGPIISVLIVGLIVTRKAKKAARAAVVEGEAA